MSKVFRAKYVGKLKSKVSGIEKRLIDALFKKEWVVYAKRPFGHPKSVVEYLGRYTHKIAISNQRLKAVDDCTVTFSYKDYRQGARKMEMSLEAMEFIRRFSMHILPRGFVRIRHYGILSSTSKKLTVPEIAKQLGERACWKKEPRTLKHNPDLCPDCKKESMVIISIIPKRGPPGKNRSISARQN